MQRLLSVLLHVPRTLWRYILGLIDEFQEKEIFLLAQAIAFKVLVTIVPILILVTAGVAQILSQDEPFDRVASFVREFLPAYQSDQLLSFIRELQGVGDTLLGIGVLGLLISAITLMTTLRQVIMSVFDQDWHSRRSLVYGYLMDFRMVLQTGVFFILSVGLTLLISNLDSWGAQVLATLGMEFDIVEMGWRRTIRLIGVLLPLFLSTLMFAQLYYFLPIPRPDLKGVVIGAFTAGVLWEVAKGAFTIYASYVGRFDRYAGGPGLSSLGEAFGLMLFFVFWVYYSGVVFIFGALIALEYEKQHHDGPVVASEPPPEPPSGETSDEPVDEATPVETDGAADNKPSSPHQAPSTPAPTPPPERSSAASPGDTPRTSSSVPPPSA